MNEICDYPYTCQKSLRNGTVLASGGFGKILKYKKKVFKLIRDSTTCKEAEEEYKKMRSIKNIFSTLLRNRNFSKNIHKSLLRLKPISPLYFWNQSFSYHYERFSCGIVSKFIKGISLRDLIHLFPNLKLEEDIIDLFPSVLVMVSMGSTASWLSLMDNSRSLSIDNPPRYFVMSLKDAKEFYDSHHFESPYGYSFKMGVLMAVLIFKAKIVPIDIEILLGNNTDINIIDLGMCEYIKQADLDDAKKIANIICHIGGPLYTKDSIQYNHYFRNGFIRTSSNFGLRKEFLNDIMDRVKEDYS